MFVLYKTKYAGFEYDKAGKNHRLYIKHIIISLFLSLVQTTGEHIVTPEHTGSTLYCIQTVLGVIYYK